MLSRAIGALLVAGVALTPADGSAQTLAEADAAFEAGEIERAAAAYEAVLASGGTGGAALAHAYLRAGLLMLWTGDEAGARVRLSRALLVEPTLATPAELSPDQRDTFEALRRGEGAALVAAFVEDGARLTTEIDADDLGALRVRASVADGSGAVRWAETVPAASRVVFTLSPAAFGDERTATASIQLLDSHSNRLAEVRQAVTRGALPPVVAEASEAEATGGVDLSSPDPPAPSDDTGVIVGVTIAVIAVLAGAGAVAGWAIWDSTPPEYVLVARQ